jgi:3-oxoacyl-[acyl-carrier protein] reductase
MGRAIAKIYAREGSFVIIADMNLKTAEGTLQQIEKAGGKGCAVLVDVTKEDDIKKMFECAVEKYGSLDILVNNAGITRDNLLLRMSESDWDSVLTVNLKSIFNLTKAVQPIMLKQRSGSIINISSVVGLEGNAGQANYAAAKAGMLGFTKSIAKELGSRNIRCNAIAPGFIETEMTHVLNPEMREAWLKTIPLRRPGSATDVAMTAVYLASDLASYITGQTISCDGGMHV